MLFLARLNTLKIPFFACVINAWNKQTRRGVVVITTAQLCSTKPELRFCAGSNPACGVSEICDGEDLWQWSQLKIRLNAFRWSTIPQNNSSSSLSSSTRICNSPSYLSFISGTTNWIITSENKIFNNLVLNY